DGTCAAECYEHDSGIFVVCTHACQDPLDCLPVAIDGIEYPTACLQDLVMPSAWCLVPCRDDAQCPPGTMCTLLPTNPLQQACLWVG
ncbi:MAG: hypothetical protein KDK70_02100, partial [Myxococcales bacterium]|nr:hypothetical protein [Myxococcales bacterium]